MYTLDTNIVIYHLDGDPDVVSFLTNAALRNAVFCVSVVAETELFSQKNATEQELARIDDFLTQCSVIPVTSPIARKAGESRRFHGTKLADSLIAATALFTGTTLLTRNTRDFRRVSELVVQRI